MYFAHILLMILLVSVYGKEIGNKIDPEQTDDNQFEGTTTEGQTKFLLCILPFTKLHAMPPGCFIVLRTNSIERLFLLIAKAKGAKVIFATN